MGGEIVQFTATRTRVAAWIGVTLLTALWIWWAGLWYTLGDAVGFHTTRDWLVSIGTFVISPAALCVLAYNTLRQRITWIAGLLLLIALTVTLGPIVDPFQRWT